MGVSTTRWQALSPLLDELLELSPAESQERLARLRLDEPALADDLESLLERREVVRRDAYLEGSALPPEAALTGQTVGSYMLDRPLARGGMGTVWLAHRSDNRFEGQVAVKFLSLALAGHGGAERFRREGDVLARLGHPNIAHLLDAGVAPGGQPYLVLEYVEGQPIDRWCDAHRLEAEARVRLFLEVLAAVEFAHSNLILHRDLKPANILVTTGGRVKLLDFGIAKLLDDPTHGGQATEVTQLAGRAFTPEYAAPEQIQGETMTMATDVYALGVLLYWLLSGQHPTATATLTPVEQLRAVVETVPLRVSLAASRKRLPLEGRERAALPSRALRGDLDNICAKALKKDPRERYATATAFADDLNRYLNDEPVAARPDSRSYRIGKFVQRHRLGVGATAATVLALIAGVIGTTWQAIEARRERDAAIFQAERAFANRNLVGLMLGALGDANRPLNPIEILDRSVALVEKQFMHDPRIAVDMLLHIAGQYLSLGETAREHAVMQRAAAIAGGTGDPGLIADVACNTVETERMRNRIDLARAQLDAGRKALSQIGQADPETEVACMQAEADIALAQGDVDLAIARASEAIERLERAGRTRGSGYPKLLSFLSNTQRLRGDLAASYDTHKKLQRLDQQLGRGETLDYFLERHNESVLLASLGEYVEARRNLEVVAARWSAATGNDGVPAFVFHSRGVLAQKFGELEDAERELTIAAARFRTQGRLDRALTSDLALASVLIELKRFDEAERLVASNEVATRATRSLPISPTRVKAELLLARGMLPQAAQAIESELAARGSGAAKDSPPLAAALRIAARVELAAGDNERARMFAANAAGVSERLARTPAKSADVGEALLLLALAQRRLGDGVASTETAKRAMQSLSNGLGAGHRLTREAMTLTGQR